MSGKLSAKYTGLFLMVTHSMFNETLYVLQVLLIDQISEM